MTCKHCCGADQLFDLAGAQKELKKYKKKGAGNITRKLISSLSKEGLQGKRLLDIGGGIGAIQWHFLQSQGAGVTGVDASNGYLEVAKTHAKEIGVESQVAYLFGDFTDVADQVVQHDVVTLDKVICCYPDYRKLLGLATDRAGETLALSFPMGGIISRSLSKMAALYMRWKKNPFRSYIHPPKEVNQFILDRGFELVTDKFSFPMLVRVYRRIS